MKQRNSGHLRAMLASIALAAFPTLASAACDLSGPPLEQAQCLLRPGLAADEPLPRVLQGLIGREVDLSERALRVALAKRSIQLADIGGELDESVSANELGEYARYFVIHDTSYPVFPTRKRFPKKIDESRWNMEHLGRMVSHDRTRSYGAHLYIDRIGRVRASHNLAQPRLSTKVERLQPELVGLFIAVECMQPRALDRHGREVRIPSPAFTAAQMDTLALSYIVASHRAKQWLIPAFHAGVDSGLDGAHDDPGNFNLKRWSARVGYWARQLQRRA